MTFTLEPKPLPLRWLNRAGDLAEAVGHPFPPLEIEAMKRAAARRTGLSDFGPPEYEAGLERLVASIERDSRLSALGRFMARQTITQLLRHRLRIAEHVKQHPAVLDEEIRRPIFILGLPRTGTTITHNLLSQDPDSRYPMVWEAFEPWPPVDPRTMHRDPRVRAATWNYRIANFLSPRMVTAHPIRPWDAQECALLLSIDFFSHQFFVMFGCSSYQRWLVAQNPPWQYERHKLYLQLMQSGGLRRKRWLLKSPPHLARIEEILRVYPDACIVQTHRDPLTTIASMASLGTMVLQIACERIDLPRLGREYLETIETLLRENVAQRQRLAGRSAQFIDLHMDEIVRDPLGCVERIYDRFALELTDTARARMKAFMQQAAAEKKRHEHRYDPADFGLDRAALAPRFAFYSDFFQLPETERA